LFHRHPRGRASDTAAMAISAANAASMNNAIT
jgi:hypothetical protein